MTSLDLIRIFLAVAKHRSFSLAAQELAISPTACSKGVRALERRHGVVLFRRTTRSVSLTEPGVSLLAMLKPAIDQIEEAFTALEPFRERPAGRLRITAPRALGLRVARLLVPGMRATIRTCRSTCRWTTASSIWWHRDTMPASGWGNPSSRTWSRSA